jgi:hypothetical protein
VRTTNRTPEDCQVHLPLQNSRLTLPMRYPNERLPETQLSLSRFVRNAQELVDEENPHDFIRFVLGGRLKIEEEWNRVFINARQGATAPPPTRYQLRRDIDSAIGITRTLPFSQPLAVFPLSPFTECLKTDNHLKWSIPQEAVSNFHFSPASILIDVIARDQPFPFHCFRSPISDLARLATATSLGCFFLPCGDTTNLAERYHKRPWERFTTTAFDQP